MAGSVVLLPPAPAEVTLLFSLSAVFDRKLLLRPELDAVDDSDRSMTSSESMLPPL